MILFLERPLYLLAGLLVCCMCPAGASAAVLIDTGAPPYYGSTLYDLSADQFLAAEFDLQSSTVITTVEGWIGGSPGQAINVRLYSDGGDVPGTVLFSGSFVTSGSLGDWQGANDLNWLIGSGTYWISFEGTNPTGPNPVAMYGSAPNPLGNEAYSYFSGGNGYWAPDDALDLGIRVSSATAVPEPSAWALAILGFGMIGFCLRRNVTGVLAPN